jgi:hypothetical protein
VHLICNQGVGGSSPSAGTSPLLLVHPNGGATGALSTEFMGREKLLALGTFPEVSLAKARERRENALRLIADNADPGVVK